VSAKVHLWPKDCLPPHGEDRGDPLNSDRREPSLFDGSKVPTWIFIGLCLGILAYVALALLSR
jgi:hypothetical protein